MVSLAEAAAADSQDLPILTAASAPASQPAPSTEPVSCTLKATAWSERLLPVTGRPQPMPHDHTAFKSPGTAAAADQLSRPSSPATSCPTANTSSSRPSSSNSSSSASSTHLLPQELAQVPGTLKRPPSVPRLRLSSTSDVQQGSGMESAQPSQADLVHDSSHPCLPATAEHEAHSCSETHSGSAGTSRSCHSGQHSAVHDQARPGRISESSSRAGCCWVAEGSSSSTATTQPQPLGPGATPVHSRAAVAGLAPTPRLDRAVAPGPQQHQPREQAPLQQQHRAHQPAGLAAYCPACRGEAEADLEAWKLAEQVGPIHLLWSLLH